MQHYLSTLVANETERGRKEKGGNEGQANLSNSIKSVPLSKKETVAGGRYRVSEPAVAVFHYSVPAKRKEALKKKGKKKGGGVVLNPSANPAFHDSFVPPAWEQDREGKKKWTSRAATATTCFDMNRDL